MSEAQPADVFAQVRSALERFGTLLEARIDPAMRERLERQRSDRLAARAKESRRREPFGDVVVVRRGQALLGFPVERAVEVRRVKPVPIPHATRYVIGLFEAHGKIGCLVDLGTLVDAADRIADDSACLAIFLDDGARVLALRVDEVVGFRTVFRDECGGQLQTSALAICSAVTADLLGVVDIGRLFERPELALDAG